VLLYFDESGDFAFPIDRYDAYVQAVLICADSTAEELDAYVAAKRREWSVEEIHGSDLTDDQLWEVCRFIRGAERLPLLVLATDTDVMTPESISAHRIAQAVRVHENAERWKAAGGTAETIERWFDKNVSAVAYSGRISDTEWVQAELLIRLVHHALNKTIVAFADDHWRDDFRDFRFIFDAKLDRKLADGEKYLKDALIPALGSNPHIYDLIGIEEWRTPPVHPFESKYGTESGTVDLRVLFEHGLQFEQSDDHPGLQLVDVVAHVARRRILERDNDTIRLAFKTIRPLLDTHRGQAIYLLRFASMATSPDTSRFTDL